MDILYKTNSAFKGAADVIPAFDIVRMKSVFSNPEVGAIKTSMRGYGETAVDQKAITGWLCDYVEVLQSFDETRHRHTIEELEIVADCKYDWRFEKENREALN